MAGLLDYGAGAGVGLENVLDRMLRERQVQQGSRRLDIEQQQGNRRLDLEQQRNQMEDALHRMQMDAAAENRKSQEQQRLEGEAVKAASLLGPGQEIDEPTAQHFAPTFLSSLVKREEPTQDQGPTQSGDEGSQFLSRIAPGRAIWMGTPAQREQQKQDEEMRLYMNDPNVPPAQRSFLKLRGLLPKGENPPSSPEFYGIEKDKQPPSFVQTDKGYRLGTDVAADLEAGKSVNPYHAPAPPVIVQTDSGLRLRSDVAKDLQGGKQVNPPVTAQTRAMQEGAKMLEPHIESAKNQAEALDQAGLFGPAMSRIRQIAAKAGTIDEFTRLIESDPDPNSPLNDRRVGKFATSLGLLATGAGRVHGGARGGSSPAMYSHFKEMLGDSSTLEMFLGRLDALDEYMGGYAAGPNAAPAKPGGGGTDPYQEYLNRKKK